MLFSGIPFLYYFLPITIILYFLLPNRFKNAFLLLASLLFYAWGEPRYVLLMMGAILAFYLCGLAIGRSQKQGARRFWLAVSIILGVGMLAVFKYADFLLSTIGAVRGTAVPLLGLSLPIGISFYTFQCMSYTVDVYRGDARPQRNLISFGAYVSLFPQLIAGPIVRYVDVEKELKERTHTLRGFSLGLRRFLIGLGKKVLLANNLGLLIQIFRDSSEKSLLFYWMYAVAFTLHIYFDFSGYSDMAIGLGRIFGFRFSENFDYPYLSKSVTEFWRRWHISLGSWFRDYVYIPLGGNRVPRWRWVCNIFIVWALTGLWHGAAWNFVLWGLMFAILLWIEKQVPALKKLPGALRHLYVMVLVVLSFVLFNAESLRQAGSDLASLLGFGRIPAVTAQTLYYLRSYGIVYLIGFLGVTPLPKRLWQRLSQRPSLRPVLTVLEPILLAVLLLVCTGYLVDGSFNPFLYFRF